MSRPISLSNQPGGLRLITLNQPENGNALNDELVAKLCVDVRALVLAGSGGVFCLGAEMPRLRSSLDVQEGPASFWRPRLVRLASLIRTIASSRLPIEPDSKMVTEWAGPIVAVLDGQAARAGAPSRFHHVFRDSGRGSRGFRTRAGRRYAVADCRTAGGTVSFDLYAGHGSAVPLAFGQQGILLSKLRAAPGSANQYVRIPLNPPPASEESVRRFLRLLVERNDALRATLVRTRDGAGLAFPSPGAVVVHRELDESLLSTEFKRGGPLFAAAFDARDPGAVHLVIDHLVCDGWSHALLLEEGERIWRFVALGEELPRPGGSLRSYMLAAGEPDELDEYTRFWRRAFERDFTLDLPRRAQATWQHIVFPFPETVGEILPYARRRFRTTDFGIVLAAFTAALLAQTSAQRSLLVYSPVVDRDESSADTIGCLLNFVAIRIDLGGTIAETIESTRDGLIGALAHQRGPFFRLLPRNGSGALVTAQPYLWPDETLTHFPGTTTVMPAAASDDWVIEDCTARPLGDLWFSFVHTRSGYHGEFAFSREFLDPQAGRAIVRTLLDVLTRDLAA